MKERRIALSLPETQGASSPSKGETMLVNNYRYIEDAEGKRIETGCGLEDENVYIEVAEGYGAKDVYVGGGHLTWEELDLLKRAIAEAESRWRPAKQGGK